VKRKNEGLKDEASGLSPDESSAEKTASRDIERVRSVQTVPAILKAVAELTRMRFVVVAKVTDQQWIACAVLDEMDFGLKAGEELEVATTLCSEVRDARAPIVIGHASKDPNYCDHPDTEEIRNRKLHCRSHHSEKW
jgi:hypothetical protein